MASASFGAQYPPSECLLITYCITNHSISDFPSRFQCWLGSYKQGDMLFIFMTLLLGTHADADADSFDERAPAPVVLFTGSICAQASGNGGGAGRGMRINSQHSLLVSLSAKRSGVSLAGHGLAVIFPLRAHCGQSSRKHRVHR